MGGKAVGGRGGGGERLGGGEHGDGRADGCQEVFGDLGARSVARARSQPCSSISVVRIATRTAPGCSPNGVGVTRVRPSGWAKSARRLPTVRSKSEVRSSVRNVASRAGGVVPAIRAAKWRLPGCDRAAPERRRSRPAPTW